ncbi:hypothetical protein MRX96_010659 [Rhipicephalus microplus]
MRRALVTPETTVIRSAGRSLYTRPFNGFRPLVEGGFVQDLSPFRAPFLRTRRRVRRDSSFFLTARQSKAAGTLREVIAWWFREVVENTEQERQGTLAKLHCSPRHNGSRCAAGLR